MCKDYYRGWRGHGEQGRVSTHTAGLCSEQRQPLVRKQSGHPLHSQSTRQPHMGGAPQFLIAEILKSLQ